VSLGDDGVSLGGRNAPSSAYCGFSPPLRLQADGTYAGGLFWDGRANGADEELQDSLAEQAQGPPLNPVEMNMESVEAVVDVVRNASYRPLFLQVFGATALDDNEMAFDNIARAIATYERSPEVQRFSSRFDSDRLTEQEMRGLSLVESHCSSCHATAVDKSAGSLNVAPAPLFTNYSYANIGVPANPLLAGNPPDLGLGGVLGDPNEYGKFKVPTLRNVALTAPYGHNGYFPTLRYILHFKSDRDQWPAPEVAENLSSDVGSFEFSEDQIDDIIAFLRSLTD
jgi:cytochrome c peroxidase